MEPQTQQENLMLFCNALSPEIHNALGKKEIDIFLMVNQICSSNGLVLYETGNICEGVERVLSGKDSAAKLISFIQSDGRLEDDNRSKVGVIAITIQTKIFDEVLPILKEAGMPIQEGRVTAPPTLSPFQGGRAEQGSVPSPYTAPSRAFQSTRPGVASYAPTTGVRQNPQAPVPPAAGAQNASDKERDERRIRALLRVAAGTSYTEEKLRDAFDALPPDLQKAIMAVDTANAIQEVAKTALLHIDQMGALGSETGLVLLGFTHPAEFTAKHQSG